MSAVEQSPSEVAKTLTQQAEEVAERFHEIFDTPLEAGSATFIAYFMYGCAPHDDLRQAFLAELDVEEDESRAMTSRVLKTSVSGNQLIESAQTTDEGEVYAYQYHVVAPEPRRKLRRVQLSKFMLGRAFGGQTS